MCSNSFCEINEEELNKVREELKINPLTLSMLGRIFGNSLWELIVISLSYAREDAILLEKMIERRVSVMKEVSKDV